MSKIRNVNVVWIVRQSAEIVALLLLHPVKTDAVFPELDNVPVGVNAQLLPPAVAHTDDLGFVPVLIDVMRLVQDEFFERKFVAGPDRQVKHLFLVAQKRPFVEFGVFLEIDHVVQHVG